MAEKDFEKMRSHPLWQEVMTKMADQALLGFAHTIFAIADSKTVQQWQEDERLAKIGFKVDMGFGLHTGWAIEGAIGSMHKIDASYLSPNVNISARLEAATNQYRVSLLLSGQFYNLLQPKIKTCCRHLDRVTVKGSKIPIDIYTLDMKPSAINRKTDRVAAYERGRRASQAVFSLADAAAANEPGPSARRLSATSATEDASDELGASKASKVMRMRMVVQQRLALARQTLAAKKRNKVDVLQEAPGEAEPSLQDILEDTDPELTKDHRAKAIKALQAGVSFKFIATYNLGTKAYLQGDWPAAVGLFDKARALEDGVDGISDTPRQLLMEVMRAHNFIAPRDWKGFRALDKK
jgi:hypothetical protein